MLKKSLKLPPSWSQLIISALLYSNCDNVVSVTTLWSEAGVDPTEIRSNLRKTVGSRNFRHFLYFTIFYTFSTSVGLTLSSARISGIRSRLFSNILQWFLLHLWAPKSVNLLSLFRFRFFCNFLILVLRTKLGLRP